MSNHLQLPLFEFAESVVTEISGEVDAHINFSDYVVYVDESGDHSLVHVDRDYPVFVLAFCVFHKRYYAEKVIPALEKFKFNHFGHDAVVLHEHEIRKQKGSFSVLTDRSLRERFMAELTSIIDVANFVLISCVIDKAHLKTEMIEADNPYHVALGVCLERLYDFLVEKNQEKKTTHVLGECRGKKEDQELELEFRRICTGKNRQGLNLPFDVCFVDKKANSAGLQLADLVARPIGIHYLRPEKSNRAFDTLEQKLFCKGGRSRLGVDYEGLGINIVPSRKAKGPGEPTEAIAPTRNPQST